MTEQEIQVMSTPERVLELIKVSSVLADRAKYAEKTAAANSQSCAQLIPGVVEACVTSGDVRHEQRAQFASALSDHGSTLRMLHKMATLKQAAAVSGNQSASTIGQSVGGSSKQTGSEKTASSRNAEAPSLTRLREALKIN